MHRPLCFKLLSVVVLLLGWQVVFAKSGPDKGMILIPASYFIIGYSRQPRQEEVDKSTLYGSVKPWYEDEWPQRTLFLKAFYIDRFEVSNQRYRRFVIQSNAAVPAQWIDNGYLLDRPILEIASTEKLRDLAANRFKLDVDVSDLNKEQLLDRIEAYLQRQHLLPVTRIDWREARKFCAWNGGRLPTEKEWEKAARGPNGNVFPWGSEWDEGRLNLGEHPDWLSSVTPVGEYPSGKSYYGIMDMAGNVMEWTADDYKAYPGADVQLPQFEKSNKVVRGGGWGGLGHYVISHLYRAAYRFYLPPEARFNDVGFRCVKDVKNESKN